MIGPNEPAPDWLGRLSALCPGRTAVTDPDAGENWTYGDLDRLADRLAGGLAARGVESGDRVATLLPNGVPLLALLFACGRLGAILAPLNWRLSARELTDLLADLEPRLLLHDGECSDLARSLLAVRALVAIDALDGDTAVPEATPRLGDPWLILYTGGTTGTPKGALLTHGSILANAVNTNLSWGLSSEDVAPSFTPMFHTGGWNVFTLPLLLLGARVILPKRFDAGGALAMLQHERATVLFLVPTMFQLLADQPDFAGADLSCLRWAISGGAPLPPAVAASWRPKVAHFKQGYGLTEVGPNNFATPDDEPGPPGTVGRLTLLARARIVDDAGRDLPAGGAGELLLAGPHMCAGYWRRPAETEAAMGDGWFYTGDVARRDPAGFYFIVDRKKDMIITGGENVYPTEVEAVLYEHPSVRECAVVGVPDPTWGEAICALVSLRPGSPATPDDLRKHLRANLARYKLPKQVIIVDDLPKSDAGKILRVRARDLARQAVLDSGG